MISVLIPSYNYGSYIATAVDSVLAQSCPNVEVVIVDNRSDDDTMPILRERYGTDRRVRIFENEHNIGLVPNFNRALEHATGEFVCWLSADDWMLPQHLQRLHQVFEREPAIDVVYSGVYLADAAGRIASIKYQQNLFPVDYVDARDELVPMLTDFNPLCLQSALFRRELFDELGAMDPSWEVVADWELAVRIALAGKRFAYLAEPSVCLRYHESMASGSSFDALGRGVVDWIRIVETYLDHPGMRRMRGREDEIVRYMDGLIASHHAKNPQHPLPSAFGERYQRLRTTLLERSASYRPARVRDELVSVVIPYTARPEALRNAIDSVVGQTFGRWEIVVVDQGLIPVGQLLRAHPAWERIAYVRLVPQRPPGAVRNFALRMLRGEFVAFLDEDNVFAPRHLESLLSTLERADADVAAAGARLVIDRTDVHAIAFEPLAVVDGVFRGPGDPAELSAVANALPLNALLHRRVLFEAAQRFNEETPILEDFDYVSRLINVGRFAFSGEQTVDVHVRLGLRDQALGVHLSRYVPILDALYAARPVPPTSRTCGRSTARPSSPRSQRRRTASIPSPACATWSKRWPAAA